MSDEPGETTVSYVGKGRYWSWLPTINGAIRRDSVISMAVESIEGAFKDGATTMWRVSVRTTFNDEPVTLRPQFFDPLELVQWVDQVFLGACFTLLPPDDIEKKLRATDDEGAPEAVRNILPPGRGSTTATIIRTIGEGLGGGDSYEPFTGIRGGRPPDHPVIG